MIGNKKIIPINNMNFDESINKEILKDNTVNSDTWIFLVFIQLKKLRNFQKFPHKPAYDFTKT